ncbi:MAG: hypothetical protein ACXAEU_02800 [Candidatus Hodarchaeales archaeon]
MNDEIAEVSILAIRSYGGLPVFFKRIGRTYSVLVPFTFSARLLTIGINNITVSIVVALRSFHFQTSQVSL